MLADEYVIVPRCAAERVALFLAGVLFAACSRPIRSSDLHHDAITGVIPGNHAFRMSPWGAATVATAAGGEFWVLVELIVPQHIVEGATIDFIKCRAHRIFCGIASTSASCLKTLGITAGHSKLL